MRHVYLQSLLAGIFLIRISAFAQSESALLNRIDLLVEQGQLTVATKEAEEALRQAGETNQAEAVEISEKLGWLYRNQPWTSQEEKAAYLITSSNYYQRAIGMAPKRSAPVLLGFAETLRQLRHGGLALKAYAIAFEDESTKEDAGLGILGLFESGLQTNSTTLLRWGDRCHTNGVIETAARCFEGVIQNESREGSVSELGLKAFELWIEVEAERNALEVSEMARLTGPIRNHPPYKQWREKLGNAEKKGALEFWRYPPERQHIAALGLLSLARKERAAKNPAVAERLCQEGLQIAPTSDAADFKILERPRSLVRLDLGAELASLYYAYPDLDPKTNKFRELEDRMFQEKMEQYKKEVVNAPLLEKFHSTLALIYAERGKWEPKSGDPDGYRNATFQMQNAVRFADQNSARVGVPIKALPHLREVWANGMAARGSNNVAKEIYMDAAEGFIDSEDLNRAEKTIKEVKDISRKQNVAPPVRSATLENVIGVRKAISKINPKTPSAASLPKWREKESIGAGVDADFAARQKERAFQELAEKATEADNKKVSNELWNRAKIYAPEGVDVNKLKSTRIDPNTAQKINTTLVTPMTTPKARATTVSPMIPKATVIQSPTIIPKSAPAPSSLQNLKTRTVAP